VRRAKLLWTLTRLLDALTFSSLWVAMAAGALCTACARAIGAGPGMLAPGVAFTGTLVVYNVDRLRDLERDRVTSPLRSAFIARHRGALFVLTGAAALGALFLALRAGPRAVAVLAPVLALGLLHRRLKRFAVGKPLYITAAWVTVVVGLPAALADAPRHGVPVAALLAATILANAIASNVRDDEAVAAALGPGVPLGIARGCALAGVGIALAAPSLRALLPIPLATLVALAAFRPGERYGHVGVDGALLLGALASLALLP
jgi:hypothetical protein